MRKIHLSPEIKIQYQQIIPVLSGRGDDCILTLLGRRRDDPARLDKILTQPWTFGEPVSIAWQEELALKTYAG